MDNIGVELAFHPETREIVWIVRLLHVHMTNVSFKREQILRELPGLDIQPHNEVVVHAAGPDIGLVIELRVIGTGPWRGHLPLRDRFRHRVEHADTVAPKLTPPQAVVGVGMASPSARTGRRYFVESSLHGLGIRLPNVVVVHIDAVHVVLRVGHDIVGIGWRTAGRVNNGYPLVGLQIHPI